MSSLIPGFEYDIFISYRQKDNKGDHWVTEFVNALKTELEATFKEDISIYFDTNPHDGLLETHNVDKSLEGKLKSLIFIPIISQTYCDTKSFAWQHEFCVFNKLAKEDQFGRDIKLGNGNVTSRILPIKIHNLDEEDKTLLENELGGALRAIEFIFKSAGVNRPLGTNEDHPQDNLNKTFYRDQVNKVANAVKEIINGLKHPTLKSIDSIANVVIEPQKVDLEKSIAVLPFTDMSPARDQEYLGDGLAEEILNSLVHVNGLKVTGRTSSFQFKGQNMGIKEISEKLQVRTVLEGSVRKHGNRIRITVQLINASDGFHLWSERYDRELDDIFAIQDDIAANIAEHLKLTFFEDRKVNGDNRQTENIEAYEMLLKGRFFLEKRVEGIEQAMQCFQKAIEMDPAYADAYVYLGYINLLFIIFQLLPFIEGFEKVKFYGQRALELDSQHTEARHLMAMVYLFNDWDWQKAETEFKKIKGHEDFIPRNLAFMTWFRAFVYGDFDFAIAYIKKQITADPFNPDHLISLVQFYCYSHRYEQSRELAKKLLKDNPANSEAYRYLGLSYLFEGNPQEAVVNFRKAVEISQGMGLSIMDLIRGLVKVGKKDEAMNIISKIEKENRSHLIPPTGWSRIYAHMGDMDKAFDWLEEAFKKKDFWVVGLKYSQDYDDLRNDPRFDKVLERMNFPE